MGTLFTDKTGTHTGASVLILRRLSEADASIYRQIRLEGLETHPDAFGSSWEEEIARPLPWFGSTLESGYVAGCERNGALVGVAGLHRSDGLKTKHRGMLWGMYVSPGARGSGAGGSLVQHIVETARRTLEELNLKVAAHNEPAIRLYRRFGFAEIGVDPHALKIGSTYVDELMMRLAF
jgi:ribosomal protein S18 acetylase RimI-like enzyme